MTYDEGLAERIRAVVAGEEGLTERRMFGGLAFLVHGHLAVSASGQSGLLVRVDPAEVPALLDGPLVTSFGMRGREMTGWLHVQDQAVASEADLAAWVDRGLARARSLPA
jgi:hypothetical protein